MGTLKTEKLQPYYKMPRNNIRHNFGFVKSLFLIGTKKHHFFTIFFQHIRPEASFFPSVFLPPKITNTRYISLRFLSYPFGTRYWNTALRFCGAFVLTTIVSTERSNGKRNIIVSTRRIKLQYLNNNISIE